MIMQTQNVSAISRIKKMAMNHGAAAMNFADVSWLVSGK
jgi:hypothetical protein